MLGQSKRLARQWRAIVFHSPCPFLRGMLTHLGYLFKALYVATSDVLVSCLPTTGRTTLYPLSDISTITIAEISDDVKENPPAKVSNLLQEAAEIPLITWSNRLGKQSFFKIWSQ